MIRFDLPDDQAINDYLEAIYHETGMGRIKYISAEIVEGVEPVTFTLRLTYRFTETPK